MFLPSPHRDTMNQARWHIHVIPALRWWKQNTKVQGLLGLQSVALFWKWKRGHVNIAIVSSQRLMCSIPGLWYANHLFTIPPEWNDNIKLQQNLYLIRKRIPGRVEEQVPSGPEQLKRGTWALIIARLRKLLEGRKLHSSPALGTGIVPPIQGRKSPKLGISRDTESFCLREH